LIPIKWPWTSTSAPHDAARDGLAHTKGVADRQHLIAHLQLVGVAQREGGQTVQLDLEHGQIGVGVGADHLRAGAAAVIELHLDRVGALDHMVVGQDVAVGADDHAAAQTGLRPAVAVGCFAKEEAKPRVAAMRVRA
jgi:hypothetical protein